MKQMLRVWRTRWLLRKVRNGVLTINEARARLGLQPWT